jgi:hypothetical protein
MAGVVKLLNVTVICNVCAVGSRTTVATPVPEEAVGGISFAGDKFTVNVTGAA